MKKLVYSPNFLEIDEIDIFPLYKYYNIIKHVYMLINENISLKFSSMFM